MASSFVHPSPLHPYSALFSLVTPFRWALCALTAALAWAGVLPLLLLVGAVRWTGRKAMRAVDACVQPTVFVRRSQAAADEWQLLPHDPLVRFHAVSPADLMWLTPRHAITPSALANPGTQAASLIHSVLVFTRRIALGALQTRFERGVLSHPAFSRFKWRAVQRRIARRCPLPDSEDVVWMESLSDAAFDIRAHVRSVPHWEWAEHVLHASRGQRGGRREEARQVEFKSNEPLLPSSFSGDAAASPPAPSSSSPPALEAHHDHARALRYAHLQSYLSQLSSTPLPPGQGLWEMLLLDPHDADADADSEDSEGDERECFVVFRCSHAIADGVLLSGIILKSFLDEEPPPGAAESESGAESRASPSLTPDAVEASDERSSSTKATPHVRLHVAEEQPESARLLSALPPADSSAVASSAPSRSKPRRSCCSPLLACLQPALNAWGFLFSGPMLLLHKSFQPDGDNALHPRHTSSTSSVSRKDICWSSSPFPLAEVKRLSKRMGVTLNDLLMALWLEVFDEYLLGVEQGEAERLRRESSFSVDASTPAVAEHLQAPESLFVLVPFNVRAPSETDFDKEGAVELGNKFAVLLVDLPMGRALRMGTGDGAADTTPFLRRLRILSSYLTHLKRYSCEPRLMYLTVSCLLHCLPTALSEWILSSFDQLCSLVITNNRSPALPLWFRQDKDEAEQRKQQQRQQQAEIERDVSPALSAAAPSPAVAAVTPCRLSYWVSWAPQRSSVGICVTILTYAGQLRVSIVAERECVRHSSCARLVERYQQKLQALASETK